MGSYINFFEILPPQTDIREKYFRQERNPDIDVETWDLKTLIELDYPFFLSPNYYQEDKREILKKYPEYLDKIFFFDTTYSWLNDFSDYYMILNHPVAECFSFTLLTEKEGIKEEQFPVIQLKPLNCPNQRLYPYDVYFLDKEPFVEYLKVSEVDKDVIKFFESNFEVGKHLVSLG